MEEQIKNTTKETSETSEQPNNYLAFAVIVAISCFAPIGAIAIYRSFLVNNYWSKKQYYLAEKASRQTWKLCWITIFVGLFFWLSIIIMASYKAIVFK